MNNDLEKLDSMPVGKAVLTNAIPAMLAMVMVLIYNMADLFFIGQTGDDLKVAAISMATPLFLLFMSLGNVFGVGGAALLSRNLGSGDHDTVQKISSFCFWSCIVVGILLSAAVFLAVDSIVIALGASGETVEMVASYLRIFSLSGVFILISSCFSALVRAEGKPEKAMGGMMLGNLINIILDPILILTFEMGVEGAAVATFIGNTCGGLYYLVYLLKKEKNQSMLSIKPTDFTLGEGIMKNILIIGVPSSLSSILMGLSQVLINGQMATYGDMAVAGIGVAMKCTMITSMVCMGIGMGVQPLLGYSIGARNEERYKAVLKFSVIFSICVSGSLTILCYLAMTPIVNGFVSDPAAFEYGYTFSQVLISTSAIMALLFLISNALQSAGAAKSAFFVNICRQGIVYIPALYILGGTFGIYGLVYAQPVADVITLIAAVLIYRHVSKDFFPEKEAQQSEHPSSTTVQTANVKT
ncbi:MAG: MATE family efflux transporter [Eubacteriales bacterium]